MTFRFWALKQYVVIVRFLVEILIEKAGTYIARYVHCNFQLNYKPLKLHALYIYMTGFDKSWL